MRHRELRNNRNIMREFDTGDLVVVRKQVKSIIKYVTAKKLLLRTKGPYRFLDKATPSSYWIQRFPFLGSRNAWKKSEGICGQDGKYTTYHGDKKACIWVRHYILHQCSTIDEQSVGKIDWSNKRRDLPSSV